MNIKTIVKLIKLLQPKYYNILTRLMVVSGLTLLAKPIWVDILNIFLYEFHFSLIGEYDWLIGLTLIIIALVYNICHRYLDLTFEYKSQPAFNKVNFKQLKQFWELCQEILPLLKDNEYIFISTGPNSSANDDESLRTDFTIWEKLKREVILPNNEAIKKLIVENKQLIPYKHENEFNKLLIHIDSFNHHIIDTDFDYSEHQFPKEISDIILITCYQASLMNKNVIKTRNWISKKLNKSFISNWFIFGSTAFIPSKANDVDLAVMLDISKENNINNVNSFFAEIKFDFKLKFKKDLHVSSFDNNSSNDYLIFSSKNPLKIEKPNG